MARSSFLSLFPSPLLLLLVVIHDGVGSGRYNEAIIYLIIMDCWYVDDDAVGLWQLICWICYHVSVHLFQ